MASQPGAGPHIRLGTPTSCGLSSSPAKQPFPRKLVEKVCSGQFVEMRELLRDNIYLLAQLKTLGGQPGTILPGASRPRLREISYKRDLLYCFLDVLFFLFCFWGGRHMWQGSSEESTWLTVN